MVYFCLWNSAHGIPQRVDTAAPRARAVMGMGSQNDTESIPDLAAGGEVRDGMVRASPSDGVPSFRAGENIPEETMRRRG
jgi:hypothetical protein